MLNRDESALFWTLYDAIQEEREKTLAAHRQLVRSKDYEGAYGASMAALGISQVLEVMARITIPQDGIG